MNLTMMNELRVFMCGFSEWINGWIRIFMLVYMIYDIIRCVMLWLNGGVAENYKMYICRCFLLGSVWKCV